jgi:hypothetical protein
MEPEEVFSTGKDNAEQVLAIRTMIAQLKAEGPRAI